MDRENNILVVDDSKSILVAIQNILNRDYTVKTASSGEKALEILESYVPDLVLLDAKMPGIDGYEVCRAIRSDKLLKFLKVIMISGADGLENRLKGYEAGVDDYLEKPFDRDELIAKVKVFSKLKVAEDQLKELNSKLSEQVRLRTDQLVEAEKMAAIGKYSAGIVHNLNNPLQAILGYSQLMEFEQPDNIIKVNMAELSPAISMAENILSSGGIVAFPTESFYGLGVNAADEEAIRSIFKLKSRSVGQPLLLLISSVKDLENYVEEIPAVAGDLMEHFWPGGLTIVFRARQNLSPLLTASTGKIGIRLSSHPVATALAESLEKPVTGTSANISGQPSCSTAYEVFNALGTRVDLILDGGKTEGGAGSTILDITVDPPRILREGMISKESLDRVIYK